MPEYLSHKGKHLHRHLLGDTDHFVVADHINGDKHDNRLENLRLLGKSENRLNSDKGVGYYAHGLKYRVDTWVKNRRVHRATFDTTTAAKKFKSFVDKLRIEISACINRR